jgi:hypothetical protein
LTAEPPGSISVDRREQFEEIGMQRIAVLAALALALPAGEAFAVSDAVKQACSSDYAAYCSEHKVGTEALRACMRVHRKMLTSGCIHALGHSDEVTEQDIREYKHDMHRE